MTRAESLIRAVLAHGAMDWPEATDANFQRAVLATCASHGVTLLLYHRLKPTQAWHTWPAELRQILERRVAERVTQDLIRGRELIACMNTLIGAGVEPLLMKGVVLAHTHYPSPALRARQDSDILIRQADLEGAVRLLEKRGYRSAQEGHEAGDPASLNHQINYQKRDDYGILHVIDVHWKISNTMLFAVAWNYRELALRSIALPALGPSVRALGPIDALLLACAHRSHHACEPNWDGTFRYGGNRLIWLYDIHLLAQSLTPPQWETLIRLAAAKRLLSICWDGFDATRRAFGTVFPEKVIAAMQADGQGNDISSQWLGGGELRRLLVTLKLLPGWRQRLKLLKESLFPPAAYMLKKYQTRRRWLLPILYGRRAFQGVWRGLR